jgi:hypothetical protein
LGPNEGSALFLGSAKANIGHGEAVSGVSGVIKILEILNRKTIVPHCGIETKINHRFCKSLQGNISSMLVYLDKNAHTSLGELS